MRHLSILALFILSFSANAYVGCTNVAVGSVQSSSGPGFHGMSNGGATGSMIFLSVDTTKCTTSNNEDLSNGAFLVIDNYGDVNNELRAYWASMLLTAKASGNTITFHAHSGGGNNWGAAVLKPYFLRID